MPTLGPPTITSASATSTYADVNWSSVSGATGYKVYSNGTKQPPKQVILCASSGTTAYCSTDGGNSFSPFTYGNYSTEYGGGYNTFTWTGTRFIATNCKYSFDGITWTPFNNSALTSWMSSWSVSAFSYIGQFGSYTVLLLYSRMFISQDEGATWTARSVKDISAPNGYAKSGMYADTPGDTWVLCSQETANKVFRYTYSTDQGQTWSSTIAQTNTAPNGGLHHHNGRWWLLKHGDNPMYSSDLQNWTVASTRSTQPHSQYNGNVPFPFAKKDSSFAVVSGIPNTAATVTHNLMRYTSDGGNTWQNCTATNFDMTSATSTNASLWYNGDYWYAYWAPASGQTAVAVSTNGISWTQVSASGLGNGGYLRVISYSGLYGSTLYNETTYRLLGLTSGSSYSTTVSTLSGSTEGAQSSAYTVATVPPAPTLGTITKTSTTITLPWSSAGTGVTLYSIYLNGSLVTTVGSGTLSYTYTSLTPSTTYTVGVSATTTGGTSGRSNSSVLTLPSNPNSVSTTSITDTGVVLVWSAPTGGAVTAYRVYLNGTKQGSDLASTTLTYTYSGLTQQTTYTLAVSAVNASGEGSKTTVTPTTHASAPSSLSTTSISLSSATLNWSAPIGATNVTAYRVYLGGVQQGSDLDPSTVSYTYAGLVASTSYTLAVTAVDAQGDGTAATTSISTLPDVPMSLAVTSITNNTVAVSWSAPSGGSAVTAYRVYSNGVKQGTDLSSTAKTYTFTSLTSQTIYTLAVSAVTSSGEGAISSTTVATVPDPPSSLATSSVTTTSFDIGWAAAPGASGITAYRVYLGGVQQGDDLDPTTTSYSFTGLVPATQYTVKVSAMASTVEGVAASISPTTLPDAPSSITVTSRTSSTLAISWPAPSGAITSYKVYVNGSLTTTQSTRTYTYIGLTSTTSYTLAVSAVTAGGEGAVATQTAMTLPNSPSSVSASPITMTSATLNWSAPVGSTGITAYRVYLGSVQQGPDLDPSTTSYVFNGFTSATTYTLKVTAVASTDESAAASVSVTTVPDVTTSVIVTSRTASTIVLGWSAAAGTISGYRVYLNGVKVGVDQGSAVRTYTFSGLSSTTTYTVGVSAYTPGGEGSVTSQSAITFPNTPSSVAAGTVTSSTAVLNWSAPTGSTGITAYRVYLGSTQQGGDLDPSLTTYTFTGLTGGTSYTLKVSAVATADESTATTVSILTPPVPPSTVSIGTKTSTSIQLTWNAATGTVSGYRVYLNGVKQGTDQGSAVRSYTFSGLSPTVTYTVGVSAYNTGGEGTLNATTAAPLPNTPTSVASGGVTTSTAVLNWSAPSSSPNITAYRVYLGSTQVTDLSNTTTTYTYTGLSSATAYTLKVSALNGTDESTATSVSVTTVAGSVASFTITSRTATTVVVGWTAASGTISGYRLYLNGVKTGADQSSSTTSYTFTTLLPTTTYTVCVSAFSAGGEGSVVTQTPITLPNTPSSVASSAVTASSAVLSWSTPLSTTSVTAYRVYLGSVQQGADLDPSTTTYTYTGLSSATAYTLKVSAVNGTDESTATSVGITTLAGPALSVTVTSRTATTVVLGWTAASGTISGYRLYLNGVKTGADQSSSTTSYTFTTLSPTTTYTVGVSAFSAGGEGTVATQSATTLPNTPSSVTSSTITTSSAILSWSAPLSTTSVTAYRIYLGAAQVTDLPSSLTTYTYTGLSSATAYTLKVSALNGTDESTATSATITTLPLAPLSITVTSRTSSTIVLGWSAPSGTMTGYRVYLNGVKQGSDLSSGTLTYTFTGLTSTTNYTVAVSALSSGGEGAQSSTTATTYPNVPTSLTLGTVTMTTAVLNWSPPSGSTGITAYRVYLGSTQQGTDLSSTATSYTFTGLTSGSTYTLGVTAVAASTDESVKATLAAYTPPTTVATFTLGTRTTTSIPVNWTPPATGTVSAYRVYLNGVKQGSDLGSAVRTYTFSTLTSSTSYTVAVSAVNNTSEGATTSIATNTLPTAPTSAAVGSTTTTSTVLTWSPPSGGTAITAYRVYLGSTQQGSDLSSAARSYTFTGLTGATSYTVKVSAVVSTDESTASSVSVTTLPNVPSSTTTSGITTAAITLNWAAPSGGSGVTNYRVYLNGVKQGSDLASTTLTYTFSTLTATTSYTVGVSAVTAGGEGAQSSIASATLPSTPNTFTVSSATTTTASLTWSAPTGGSAVTAYRVYLGSTKQGADLSGTTTTYTLTGLTAATAYTAKVSAVTVAGEGAVTTVSVTTLPNAPSSATLSNINTAAITLSWAVPSGGASVTNYRVYLNGTKIGTDLASTTLTYTFTGLTATTSYTVGVSAVTAGGEGAQSSIASATLANGPNTLAVSSVSTTTAALTWSAPTGGSAVTAYRVYLGGTKQGSDLSASTTSYTYTGLTSATTYTLKVSAVTVGGEGSQSSTSVMTLPASPTLSTVVPTTSSISIRWSAPAGTITAYRVYLDGAKQGTDLGSATRSYAFTGLTSATNHTVAVTAVASSGESAVASSSTATLPPSPTSLTSSVTAHTITLSWSTTGGPDTTAFRVYVNNVQQGTDLDASTTAYTITGLSPVVTYLVEVSAVTIGGEGARVSANITTLSSSPTLGTATADTTSITLTWVAPPSATNNIVYKVYMSTNLVASVSASTLSYKFTDLTPASFYTVGVAAYDNSLLSATVSTTQATLPVAPQITGTSSPTATTLVMNWSAPSPGGTAITTYGVYLDGVLKSSTVPASTTSYTFTGLVGATIYTVAVSAINGSGEGATAQVDGVTSLAAPTITKSTSLYRSITLKWTAPASGATILEYRAYKDGVQVGTSPDNVCKYSFRGLTTETQYTLAISAVTCHGEGELASDTYSTQSIAQSLIKLATEASTADASVQSGTVSACSTFNATNVASSTIVSTTLSDTDLQATVQAYASSADNTYTGLLTLASLSTEKRDVLEAIETTIAESQT